MNATELAHWRYRVKALPGEMNAIAQSLAGLGVIAAYYPEEGDQYRHVQGEAQKLCGRLDFAKYLLEEAKYMVELGELCLTS